MSAYRDYNDALRVHTEWRKTLATHMPGMANAWLRDRWNRYGPNAAVPSAEAWKHVIEDTLGADTCWMSHEMMDLVQRAMVGYDEMQPVTADDIFIPHGFMVFPEAWMSLDVRGKKLAQRALLWRYVDPIARVTDGVAPGETFWSYDLNSEGEEVAGVRFMSLSHVDDPDDYPLEDELVERAHAVGFAWNVSHATTIPLRLMNRKEEVSGEGDHNGSWLRFWRVIQALMGETIVTTERRKAARPTRRAAERAGLDVGAPRVIELRRPRGKEADPEGERVRDVNWTHRWIVGGHWRQQPYPSLGIVKQRWIGAYEKGPENLPLVIRERVWNWDR